MRAYRLHALRICTANAARMQRARSARAAGKQCICSAAYAVVRHICACGPRPNQARPVGPARRRSPSGCCSRPGAVVGRGPIHAALDPRTPYPKLRARSVRGRPTGPARVRPAIGQRAVGQPLRSTGATALHMCADRGPRISAGLRTDEADERACNRMEQRLQP